jgi:CheY-like chemotaxis protein
MSIALSAIMIGAITQRVPTSASFTRECWRVSASQTRLSPVSRVPAAGPGLHGGASGIGLAGLDTRLVTAAPLVDPPTSRILVIDDDEAVRTAFQLALDDFPTELVLASDGLAGLDVLGRASVDLVFLDLRMPGIDGVETLHRLRSCGVDCAICIMTGYAEEYMVPLIEATSEELGFELFRKPLEMQDIRAIALTLLPHTPQ